MNYVNKIAGIAAIALAALPLVAIAGVAEAATVKVSDLNVATIEGQLEFRSRVQDAASDFCRDRAVNGLRTASHRACVAGVEAEMTEKLAAQQSTAKAFAAR